MKASLSMTAREGKILDLNVHLKFDRGLSISFDPGVGPE